MSEPVALQIRKQDGKLYLDMQAWPSLVQFERLFMERVALNPGKSGCHILEGGATMGVVLANGQAVYLRHPELSDALVWVGYLKEWKLGDGPIVTET